MAFIDDVRNDRADLARVLKKHKGIRKIVEDLYPDSAHFIYELLQNAEDTGASQADFELTEGALKFRHNGRPFDEDDIWGITDIGEGSKAGEEDKIGRFGVGFKAVFAYSETPSIVSPTYSFRIMDLVLPHELAASPECGNLTSFEFPFNNAKKPAADAYREIRVGLQELAETTLLFLAKLESITWNFDGKVSEVLRVAHSDNHIEILHRIDGQSTTSAHFLRFLEPAAGAERQNVAIAFELSLFGKLTSYEPSKSVAKQLKIVSASPGHVAVFFPAEKETSGLRFHLHAPFVPELSRASVKETPANAPLFAQLADLSAKSLHKIRDMGLLTTEFLAVLPNPQDLLPARYHVIREAILTAMRNEPLTPTHAKGHAPAKYLVQGEADLRALLSAEDIEYLIEYDEEPPQWAVGASQKNSNVDRFLIGLGVKQWDIDSFLDEISLKTVAGTRYLPSPPYVAKGPDAQFMEWLEKKPLDWHQSLYALLGEHLANAGHLRRSLVTKLAGRRIVRLRAGGYAAGEQCFFPGGSGDDDETLPRVDAAVYSSGRGKVQQESARQFLKDMGVRDVGELEQVEAILRHRYVKGSIDGDMKDLRQFIGLVKRDPESAKLFEDYYVFKIKDGRWAKPSAIYLDEPYLETGLSEYHEREGTEKNCFELSDSYLKCGVSVPQIAKFAAALGARTRLVPSVTSCAQNPDWDYLRKVGGERWTSSSIDKDYVVPGLKDLLDENNGRLSRIVWRSMNEMPQSVLKACYQKNQRYGARYADSQLVHDLRNACWVPQTDGSFVPPGLADPGKLPGGFDFDAGRPWIKAVKFGDGLAERTAKEELRKVVLSAIGIPDDRAMERCSRFIELPAEEQERLLEELEARRRGEIDDPDVRNAERRAKKVKEDAAAAPDRGSEMKLRAVAERRDAVRRDADPYLIQQYRSADGVMVCQVDLHELPFRLEDGSYYFESVEIVTRAETGKHHTQNYLCLCPNHAAMFRYANPLRERLRERIEEMTSHELELELAGKQHSIVFSKRHKIDLLAALQADPRPARAD